MTSLGEDPAVLTWRIALAPRPRFSTNGRHWWRELVTAAWRSADHAWWLSREAIALGYRTEQLEHDAEHPRPRLGDFMRHLSSGSLDPELALTSTTSRRPI